MPARWIYAHCVAVLRFWWNYAAFCPNTLTFDRLHQTDTMLQRYSHCNSISTGHLECVLFLCKSDYSKNSLANPITWQFPWKLCLLLDEVQQWSFLLLDASKFSWKICTWPGPFNLACSENIRVYQLVDHHHRHHHYETYQGIKSGVEYSITSVPSCVW